MRKIRKRYDNLTELEKTRYWNCIKMLNLMTADDPVSFKKPRRWINTYKKSDGTSIKVQVDCRTKYDQIVTIHSTSCEHGNNLFGYFHRNYIGYVQMFLSKADKILRNLDQQTELFLTNRKDHIRVVEKIAHQNESDIPAIFIPYWNILDADKGVIIPEILKDITLNNSYLDKLYLIHTGAPLGYFNPEVRWMSSQKAQKAIGKQNKKQLFYRSYIGLGEELWQVPQDISLDPQTQRILEQGVTQQDLYNMRHTKAIKDGKDLPISSDLNKQFDDYHFKRILSYYDQSQGLDLKRLGYFSLNPLKNNAIDYMYGNGKFSYEKINSMPTDEKYKDSEEQNKENFNLIRSSYIYGLSLINPDFFTGKWEEGIFQKQTGFLCGSSTIPKYTKSFEQIHDSFHVRLGFSMRHTSYSVLNPLFFIYHSTIDFMLQLKMRMIRSDYKFKNDSLNLVDNIQEHTMSQLQRFFNTDLDQKFIQNKLDWYHGSLKYKIYKAQQASKFKDMKIIDWTNGDKSSSKYISLSDFSDSGFTYYNYMIKNQNGKSVLRLSNQMNEVLKKSRYNKYQPFFNWDYQYEELTQQSIQSRGGQLIPEYLLKAINTLAPTVQKYRQLILNQAGFTQKIKLPKNKIKQITSEINKGLNINQVDKNKAQQILQAYSSRIQQLIKTQVLRITYQSTISSQSIILYLNLKKQFKNKYTSDELIDQFCGNFMINNLTIFSKQSDATTCPKCTKCKHQFVKLSDNLKGRLSNLYLDIAIQTRPGIIYDNLSELHLEKQTPISNIVTLLMNNKDNKLSVEPILGAQSVTFKLNMCQKLPGWISADKSCYNFDKLNNFDQLSDEYQWRFSIKSESVSLTDSNDVESFISYTRNNRNANSVYYNFPMINFKNKNGQTTKYLHKNFSGQIILKRQYGQDIIKEFNFEFRNFRKDTTYYFYISAQGEIVILNKETYDYQVLIECANKFWN